MAEFIPVGASKAAQLKAEMDLEEYPASIVLRVDLRKEHPAVVITQRERTIYISDEETVRELGRGLLELVSTWGKWD